MNRRAFLKRAGCLAIAALAASYPLLIERRLVQVNTYLVPLPDLPRPFAGFRAVHLSDLHLGRFTPAAFIEGVVSRVNALKPDAVFCTGDYVLATDTVREVDTVWPILSRLTARHGVFTVLGNHDHWADEERSLAWLARSQQSVRHRCRVIHRDGERLVVGGSGDFMADHLGIDESFRASAEGDCRILLSHNPDSLDSQFDTDISLMVSGHTHGGQVVLPFWGPPVLPVNNKRYSSGVIHTQKSVLFISRGIGWALYPVRFNCPPEIAVLVLTNPGLKEGEDGAHEAPG